MLDRAKKAEVINELKSGFESANAVFLTNLIGLTSNDAVELRKNLRDADAKISVTRNSLFEKASVGTVCEQMMKDLKGPHAVAFAKGDVAAVAKALKEAGEKFESIVSLKAGILKGQALTSDELVQLATLPGKDQMVATLLATFNAPVSAFVRVINAIGESKDSGEAEVEASENETVEK
jgi:large subunit ribosomal protein L10